MKIKTKLFAKITLAIFLLATFSPVFSQDKKKLSDEIKKFDEFYQKSVKDWNIVGNSFMLIHDNQVLDKQFYGTAHVENKTAVDENTI